MAEIIDFFSHKVINTSSKKVVENKEKLKFLDVINQNEDSQNKSKSERQKTNESVLKKYRIK